MTQKRGIRQNWAQWQTLGGPLRPGRYNRMLLRMRDQETIDSELRLGHVSERCAGLLR
jgi:hypothetical protein